MISIPTCLTRPVSGCLSAHAIVLPAFATEVDEHNWSKSKLMKHVFYKMHMPGDWLLRTEPQRNVCSFQSNVHDEVGHEGFRRGFYRTKQVCKRLATAIKEAGPEVAFDMEDLGTCVGMDVVGTNIRSSDQCHGFFFFAKFFDKGFTKTLIHQYWVLACELGSLHTEIRHSQLSDDRPARSAGPEQRGAGCVLLDVSTHPAHILPFSAPAPHRLRPLTGPPFRNNEARYPTVNCGP